MNRRAFLGACFGAFLATQLPTPKPTPQHILIQSEASLKRLHGLAAERELSEVLALEITKEIDAEVLRDLRMAA